MAIEQLIQSYYQAILRVDPTESQIERWLGLIDENNPEPGVDDLVASLFLQAEEVLSVMRIYQVVLGRTPDSGGLDFWVQVFRDIREANPDMPYQEALVQAIRDWLSSDEFVAVYGDDLTDEEYVALLYINVLGREPEPAGFNFWVNELKIGAITREGLVIAFSESEEFKASVDADAEAILLYDAQVSSEDTFDDPEHRVENDDPYASELYNEAPTDILIGTDIDEDAENGDLVNEGQLTAVDPDAGETFTWELIDPSGAFGLDDPNAVKPNIIVVDASKLDHETAEVMTVTIRVTDSAGHTYEEEVEIDINNVNEAPYNLDLSNLTIAEQDGSESNPGVGGLVVGVLTSEDVDDGDTATYTLLSQSVAGAFEIVGDELRVLDPSVIDSEAGVTSVDVEIQVEDSDGLTQVKTFTIDVTSLIDEDPTNVLPETLEVAATTPAGLTLADLLAEDPESDPDSHTFSITNDPTGGAFGIDPTGKQLVLADPSLISSTNLVDGGPVDEDGVVNGLVQVTLDILIEDSNGNTYADTIVVTVDQNGLIIPFTDTVVEVLDGSNGDDTFTANAGYGPNDAPTPGFQQTANAGDIANGMDGDDLFVLTKQDNEIGDGAAFVTGVTLNNIEDILIINRDVDRGTPASTSDILDDICTPCINMPVLASSSDDPLVFEASLSPDLDHVAFGQSLASVGIWDLQADFWTITEGDANDHGPVVDIFDVTGDYVWIDSDPQSKLAGAPIDEIVFNVDEVLINELRISENASGNEPGGPRSEQVGTIRIVATGVPSVIGGIYNGFPGGDILEEWDGSYSSSSQPTTHTLIIEVEDLTGSRPTSAVGEEAAAANTAAIDFFAGQDRSLGNSGLSGLEDVVITGDGDVFLVFDEDANDVDSDGDGRPLEIVDGAGSSFFFFEEDGFSGVQINGGEGFDTLGVFADDLDGQGFIFNIERIKIVEDVGGTYDTIINLGAVHDTALQEVVFADGVDGDLAVYNIPDIADADQDPAVLCETFGNPGVQLIFDQCCNDDGNLPDDFDLFLDAEGSNARVDTIWKVDPGSDTQRIDNFNVVDIQTLHLSIVDCDPDTSGLFEINHLSSQDFALQTLLLTDDGTAGTTRILNDDWRYDSNTSSGGFDEVNRFGPDNSWYSNLTLIKGTDGVREQQFLELDGNGLNDLKLPSVLSAWANDTFVPVLSGSRAAYDPDKIEDELVVSDDGVTADLGEASDMITGNRITADGVTPGFLGEDFIRLNGGDDLAFGAAGNDQIEGGTGDDEIHGEDGDDSLFGDEGADLILGGSGNDYADGGADHDVILGGSGNDTLRGGDGNDALCGDDGDDSLHGEAGDDLLIGGQGDDFLDAGADGTDMLVGDYGCEPSYVNITVPAADLEEGDTFTIGVDLDGNGKIDGDEEFEVTAGSDPTVEGIAQQLADMIQAKLDTESDVVQACWMVEAVGGVVRLCKVDDGAPLVSFEGTDAPVASVHKFEFDGQVHPTDEIQLSIDLADQLPTNFNLNSIPGLTLPANGRFYDSVSELLTLAQEVADYLDGLALPAGYGVEANAQGEICIIGPGDDAGTVPAIAFTIADGSEVDAPADPEVQYVDLSDLSGFEVGDEIVVDWSTVHDGLEDVSYIVQLGDTLDDIVAGLLAAIDAGAGVWADIDPNDPYTICIISDTPGLAGAFNDDAAITLVEDAGTPDQFVELTFTDFDADGEAFSVDISDDNGPVLGPVTYGQVFDTSLLKTLQNFIAQHGATILADHGLAVSIGGTLGNETLVFSGENFGGNRIRIAADYTGNGSVSRSARTDVNATLDGGSTGIKQLPQDDFQDDTQSIVDHGNTVTAEPREDLDLSDQIEFEDKSEPGQDVFVVSARANDMAAFANDGYDNDHRPGGDFEGLLAAAGLTPGDGAGDNGVDGVVYVMDFNQGSGGDDLSTYNVNEAYDKAANTTKGGRFYDDLLNAFGSDAERYEGDKLSFRNSDGELDDCGTTFNYEEEQDQAVNRDDSDANAVNAFNANDDLRYFVSARSFEDALLDNHGLIWGVDVDQAIVDDALADLADDGLANNSAGGLADDARWGDAEDLLNIMDAAKGESWMRVYYNEPGTDAAPEAVMELVGLDDVSQFSFKDIVGADCIEDSNEFQTPEDIWLTA